MFSVQYITMGITVFQQGFEIALTVWGFKSQPVFRKDYFFIFYDWAFCYKKKYTLLKDIRMARCINGILPCKMASLSTFESVHMVVHNFFHPLFNNSKRESR